MAQYYLLVKRKGSKKWGYTPTRPGVSLDTVRRVVKKNLKRGWVAKVVSRNGFNRLVGGVIGRRVKNVSRRRKRRATRAQLRALRKARRARMRRR